MKKEKARDLDEHVDKAKETLLSRKDFNFETNNSNEPQVYGADLTRDGQVPTLGKFESSKAKYLTNLKTERFKEPRMFTMEQIRNMVFAVMDQSTLNDRVSLNESRYCKVHETGLDLAKMDIDIKNKTNEMNEKMKYEVELFKEKFE